MLEMNFFFWLSSILIVAQNLDLSKGIVVEKWIEQYQDHFDNYNGETWLMRYYENDEFYHQSGPIFIKIGGESAITPNFIGNSDSFIYKMAEIQGAIMYNIEHRYYGESYPVLDTSLENLRYLNVEQTLADVASFIKTIKQELNDSNAFVMVFGGSYSGNLAAWMRVKYPKLVQAALATSAPIYVQSDYPEYYLFAGNSIRKYDEDCALHIKEAFSELEELLKSPAINSIKFKNDFKMCRLLNSSQPAEIPFMFQILANIFSNSVINYKIEVNGKTTIENICSFMKENRAISSYHALAEIFKEKFLRDNDCIDLNYHDLMDAYRHTFWESKYVEERLWTYQTCTEFGYFRTFSSPKSIFGALVTQKSFSDQCRDVFAAAFNADALEHRIKRINHLYNSKLSNTKNIIFTNGDLDPWRSLSVLSDPNADSPAILIKGASHCGFLRQERTTEVDSFMDARCQASSIIAEWLYTYKHSYD